MVNGATIGRDQVLRAITMARILWTRAGDYIVRVGCRVSVNVPSHRHRERGGHSGRLFEFRFVEQPVLFLRSAEESVFIRGSEGHHQF